MKGIAVTSGAAVEPRPSHPIAEHQLEGQWSCRLVSPVDFSLWMVAAEAEAGARLQLPDIHGDEAIYVSSGSVAVGERVCPTGGAVVVESAARDAIRVLEPSRLVHMGPVDPGLPTDGPNGPVERAGDETHVVGPGGMYAAVDEYRDSRYFADSTCPTCRLTLLYTSRRSAYVSPTHSHSASELIHVVWGRIDLGSIHLGPGDTLAIEADRRYGFRAPDGFGFINYRRDASQQTIEPGSTPRMEGALVNGFDVVMDLR